MKKDMQKVKRKTIIALLFNIQCEKDFSRQARSTDCRRLSFRSFCFFVCIQFLYTTTALTKGSKDTYFKKILLLLEEDMDHKLDWFGSILIRVWLG